LEDFFYFWRVMLNHYGAGFCCLVATNFQPFS
jgi:hypothetical protein